LKNITIDPRLINNFLERTLFNIEKPGRYLGGEYNQVTKDWDTIPIRTVLAFPDLYEIGFSNLGLRILYEEINGNFSMLAERCYSVGDDMEMAMRNNGIPLFSLESKHALHDFDVIGISIPYETLYTNTLNLLDLAGIPIHSKDRSPFDPIIMAGGHATFNPAPMSTFIDVFVIGDGEIIFSKLLQIIKEGLTREENLKRMSEMESVYVPLIHDSRNIFFTSSSISKKTIKKNMIPFLPSSPEKPLVPNIEITHDRLAIEVMRGCSHGCRFCQAGFVTRPVRERPIKDVLSILKKSLRQTGYDEISLLSLSISDYSAIQELVFNITHEFKDLNIKLSLPSLRIESFSETLMHVINQKKGNFTLAPESASENLRQSINKNISDENLLETASLIFKKGWTSLKLYFMIGLPGENLGDVEHIIELCKQIKSIAKRMIGARARIAVSVNTFIPKCHTPFQWSAMDSIENIQKKQQLLKDGFKNTGIFLSLSPLNSSLLEGWLSRGDQRTGQVIATAWQKGAKFDAWQDRLNITLWKDAFAESGIDPSFYSHRTRSIDEPLPWDFIDIGVDKSYLQKEYQHSLEGLLTSDCRLNCHACGIQTSYNIHCHELVGE